MKLVLAIDGGGIRGILPGRLLQVMQESGTYPHFDLIAGTSTGGILACGLTSGIPAKTMLGLYTQHGGEVFDRKLASGVLDPKYDSINLESLLKSVLGDRKLSQVSPELLIPSYCVQNPVGSWFFKSWQARTSPQWDYPLWQVARATSAAPTYFPTASVKDGWFIDGGVFANNPALCAWADAKKLWPGEDIKVLSLGTGAKVTAIDGPASAGWGIVQWVTDIASVFMDGTADSTSYILQEVLGDNLLRCEIPLHGVDDAFDNASPQNITNLQTLGAEFVNQNMAKIKGFLA